MLVVAQKHVNISHMTLSEIQEKGLEHLLIPPKRKRTRILVDPRFKLKPGDYHRTHTLREKTWSSVSYWHRKLERTWESLTENQKAHYSVELMKMLVGKLNNIPANPRESRINAEEAISVLKSLEDKKQLIPSSTTSATPAVETVTAPPPVEEPAIISNVDNTH
jgi:hypothetical protein